MYGLRRVFHYPAAFTGVLCYPLDVFMNVQLEYEATASGLKLLMTARRQSSTCLLPADSELFFIVSLAVLDTCRVHSEVLAFLACHQLSLVALES